MKLACLNDGERFRVTASTVVCGAHFFSSAAWQGSERHFKPGAVPSLFVWQPFVTKCPTPKDRSTLSACLCAVHVVVTCVTVCVTALEQVKKQLDWNEVVLQQK